MAKISLGVHFIYQTIVKAHFIYLNVLRVQSSFFYQLVARTQFSLPIYRQSNFLFIKLSLRITFFFTNLVNWLVIPPPSSLLLPLYVSHPKHQSLLYAMLSHHPCGQVLILDFSDDKLVNQQKELREYTSKLGEEISWKPIPYS